MAWRFRISAVCAIHGGNEGSQPDACPHALGSRRQSGWGLAYAPATFCEWCSPCGGTGQANRRDRATPCQNGKRPRRRPGRYAPRSRTDRLALFGSRGGGNPLGQEPSDFFYGHSTASLGVADALINGGKGFLVFLLIDGGRVVEVNSTGVSHSFAVARISG